MLLHLHPLPLPGLRPALQSLIAASVLIGAACAKSDTAASGDTAGAAVVAGAGAAGADTGMAGMNHSKMAGMDRGPAKDADHEFLRMMSDHHEGLIALMDAAMERASTATAKADAKKLHDKQHQERDRMVGMIKTSYGETIEPMVMPHNEAMNDSLQQKSGAEYDHDMYRHVVMHHREGVQMIDRFLPRLQKADVKTMAEKMRADQQREITEFERKQGR